MNPFEYQYSTDCLEAQDGTESVRGGDGNTPIEWTHRHGGRGASLTYLPDDHRGVWKYEAGDRVGILCGAVTNLDELGTTHDELFERLLDGDAALPAEIEGAFLLVGHDAATDQWTVVTDKLGSRPCFYTTDGRWFADSVGTLVSRLHEPAVDLQAVADMLLMGHLWGDRTLVEGIRMVRPATVLRATNGTVSTERYWRPNYEEAEADERYTRELVRRYRQAVARTARTLPAEAGIWLSGGLDSRTTVAVLNDVGRTDSTDFRRLRSFTYDSNPPTKDNPEIAARVATALGIEHEEVPLTDETFAEVFERVIEATDGTIQWNSLANLSATYNIDSLPPVMLEGMQGELVGDHPFRYHLESDSAVEAQYASEAARTPETVRGLLTVDVDPLATFREEAARSPESTHRGTVLDAHFQNYYSRSTLMSDRVMRKRTGSRTPQVDGDYLEWCARLPQAYRKGTFPFTEHFVRSDAGGVPLGTSRAKLALCRRLAPAVADVTYERTKTKPSWLYPAHAVGFVLNVLVGRLRGEATYGNGSLADQWIRDTDSEVHRLVAGLVEDACERPLFDAATVRAAFDEHMNGANNASLLASITTVEYWLQHHLDPVANE
ncbi:asparagine synthase-related protein [Halobellus rarus]|uniref:Asparagine synthase-related protein n=1 Tax=Halobellus rarus TaxID=1126237 RepID=A0ABD6CK29_9EURY|nr:asparagine synthase-related protein [Halobellus rarus]